MVASSIYAKYQQEKIKELKREQIEDSYKRAMGAENIREDAERTKALAWADTNSRVIIQKRGSDKVEGAGAGVTITAGAEADLRDADWDNADSELAGKLSVIETQNALLGDLRQIELLEVKEDRLEQYEKADALEWAFAVGNAIATGVSMEQKAGTWQNRDSLFGIDADTWPEWVTAGWDTELT